MEQDGCVDCEWIQNIINLYQLKFNYIYFCYILLKNDLRTHHWRNQRKSLAPIYKTLLNVKTFKIIDICQYAPKGAKSSHNWPITDQTSLYFTYLLNIIEYARCENLTYIFIDILKICPFIIYQAKCWSDYFLSEIGVGTLLKEH